MVNATLRESRIAFTMLADVQLHLRTIPISRNTSLAAVPCMILNMIVTLRCSLQTQIGQKEPTI